MFNFTSRAAIQHRVGSCRSPFGYLIGFYFVVMGSFRSCLSASATGSTLPPYLGVLLCTFITFNRAVRFDLPGTPPMQRRAIPFYACVALPNAEIQRWCWCAGGRSDFAEDVKVWVCICKYAATAWYLIRNHRWIAESGPRLAWAGSGGPRPREAPGGRWRRRMFEGIQTSCAAGRWWCLSVAWEDR